MNNDSSKRKAIAHLHMIYGLANDLNGAFGSESVQKLMKLYGETFNHITTEILPSLGMSEESIEDLVAGLDEAYDPFLFEPMKSVAA